MTECPANPTDALARYHRQMLLPGIGEAGQRALGDAHALVVGCGALGSVIVDTLARAGVGTLTIVDRDVVEITNLQRQVLFDESDVTAGMPKAEAARNKVARINGQVTVHAHVDDFNPSNAEALATGVDVILDGLDNFETRYLLNDLAVKHDRPYIYGGAIGTSGVSMTVLPGETPCLRCVFPEPPPPGSTPTCDTAGVLAPAVIIVAAHQAAQAIKILTGHRAEVDRTLLSIDVWSNELRRFDMGAAYDAAACPCCGRHEYAYLEGGATSASASLCGRNAVQITPGRGQRSIGADRCDSHVAVDMDLAELARRLAPHGTFEDNGFLIRGVFDGEHGLNGAAIELTLFPNGRAIIKGTPEPDVARTIYAKYVGA